MNVLASMIGDRVLSVLNDSFKTDRDLAETYQQVVATGKPRYDQVIAALNLPNDTVHWAPYHRIIFPLRQGAGQSFGAIASQISKVDFDVV